ncbi:hypothetical protein TBLA_0H02640 [Henningerozyma blattae CBS 6284]|uniref:DNA primase large subunit n=1 Tax=Henningerozyma blattae (strain ATCC 34711 / CBS 6284 / DSM 70876 / NBRC 10599 / NRRL Y-10934 / UCD 77-7) TaxID=1071380 RepID=I2H846_HENB6|nr:hypothetical protein TBLA_0H02640 [Tetrapisispora blattae CBS 6284]CCH62548.1 hypothetical protein TBLA_0H02640 [Tetrapisispora blattae CBS 6284]
MFRQNKRRLTSRRNFQDQYSNNSIKHELTNDSSISKLNFYNIAPTQEITLDNFEIWAIDRLKVLIEIETMLSRSKNIRDIETSVKPILNKYLPMNTAEDQEKDYYSHFILRLCFCRSKELRARFINTETILFKLRYNMLTSSEQTKFVEDLQLDSLKYISDDEKNEFSTELYSMISPLLTFQLNLTDENSKRLFFQNEKFIKLPFENVTELLSNRQVFLHKGWAYIGQFQQLNLLTNEFSQKLETSLLKTYSILPKLNEDDRLLPIIQHLSSGYNLSDLSIGSSYLSGNATGEGEITSDMIYDKEMMKNYPLSVLNLLEGLRENHHLRYNGRQQLGMFLKGIGLSVDEALKFWANEFVYAPGAHMTLDKFNKEYRYNIRHTYGLEGNRINYKPWDFRTILSKPRPARGEYHGCPYRDWSHEKLTSYLKTKMGLSLSQINQVMESVEQQEYAMASTKVFEMTIGKLPEGVTHIVHPNQYFDLARAIHKRQSNANDA